MDFEYATNRLEIKILDASYARMVLRFFVDNKDVFEPFEPLKPGNFYTFNYLRSLMSCEYRLTVQMKLVRFWVFLKGKPDTVIGTISYQDFKKSPYQSCRAGYRFDKDHWHCGYAAEALDFTNRLVFRELSVHRIEAFAMPQNRPSIRLLERLGFVREGFCRSSAKIRGKWEDHYLYALLSDDESSLHQ